MPKTKVACIIQVVSILVKGAQGVAARDKMEIANLPGCNKELLEALSPETLLALLQGALRARSQESKAQPWEKRPLEFWWKVVHFGLWMVAFTTPIGLVCILLIVLVDPADYNLLPSRVYLPLKGTYVDYLLVPVLFVGSICLCWAFLGSFWVCIFFALLYFCWIIFTLLHLHEFPDIVDKQWKGTL